MAGDVQTYGAWQLEVMADPAGSDHGWCVAVRPLQHDGSEEGEEPTFYAATRNDALAAARRYVESLRE